MDNTKVALEDRFSPLELATMFTIECAPDIDHKDGSRMKNVDKPYVFNDVKVPLWTITKKAPSRGEKAALQTEDYIKDGISAHPPGSEGRIADLMTHYNGVDADTQESDSAFTC